MAADPFYCRYYVGHKGKFGHEFMEFEITADGKLRYSNNSNYKNDFMIRKEVFSNRFEYYCIPNITFHVLIQVILSQSVIEEIKRIILESEIIKEDDRNWPPPDKIGRQELEIKLDKDHISFTSSKIGSLLNVQVC